MAELTCEFWRMPDDHLSMPVLLFDKDFEAPEAPSWRGRRAHWNQVADDWLAERLEGLTSNGPKKALLRRRGKRRVIGSATRDHRNEGTA